MNNTTNLNKQLEKELNFLRNQKNEDIDFSDAPEITDFSNIRKKQTYINNIPEKNEKEYLTEEEILAIEKGKAEISKLSQIPWK